MGTKWAQFLDSEGTKDIKMTLRYAHLAPTHKVKTLDVLNNILTRRPTAQLLHNALFRVSITYQILLTSCKY